MFDDVVCIRFDKCLFHDLHITADFFLGVSLLITQFTTINGRKCS